MSTGFALSNHIIKNHTTDTSMDCAVECTAVLECVSFNFRTTENLQMESNCQLNDATKDSSLLSDFGEAAGLVYYEAETSPAVSNL